MCLFVSRHDVIKTTVAPLPLPLLVYIRNRVSTYSALLKPQFLRQARPRQHGAAVGAAVHVAHGAAEDLATEETGIICHGTETGSPYSRKAGSVAPWI